MGPAAPAGPSAGDPAAPAPRETASAPIRTAGLRVVGQLDEATLEMEARAEGVLVFRDAKTERMRILYRREDGNLGLIEPEA